MHFSPAEQSILLTAGINFSYAAKSRSEQQNRDAISRKPGSAAGIARSHRGFRVFSFANRFFQEVGEFADVRGLKPHQQNRRAIRRLMAGSARAARVITLIHDLQS